MLLFHDVAPLYKAKMSETVRYIQHQGLRPYNVCSKFDTGLTLTYFTARSTWCSLILLYGKMAKILDFKETMIKVYEQF